MNFRKKFEIRSETLYDFRYLIFLHCPNSQRDSTTTLLRRPGHGETGEASPIKVSHKHRAILCRALGRGILTSNSLSTQELCELLRRVVV